MLHKAILDLDRLDAHLASHERKLCNLTAIVLRDRYPALIAPDARPYKDEVNQYGFKCYSQNNEDGILLYIFSQIGTSDRRFVEFGVQDGQQCNAATLALNFGWSGLFMDGDGEGVAAGRRYYADLLGLQARRVRFVQCFATAENINQVLRDNGVLGEIDLLSIDVDGNDYWIWQAISAVHPRVVAIEYNASFGSERSVTIPYKPDFVATQHHPSGFYHGASLVALTNLAHLKGYTLIGCDNNGVNAFFVRRDMANGKLREVAAQDAYFPHARRQMRGYNSQAQFDMIKHLPLVEV